MDTSTIIWLIVAGAAMLLSQPKRRRQNGNAEHEAEDTAPQRGGTGSPAMPTPAAPWPFPTRTVVRSKGGYTEVSASKRGGKTDVAATESRKGAGRTGTKAPERRSGGPEMAKRAMPLAASAKTTAKQPVAERVSGELENRSAILLQEAGTGRIDPSGENRSAARIAAEFDLKRAVIYAEILKPKFEEY